MINYSLLSLTCPKGSRIEAGGVLGITSFSIGEFRRRNSTQHRKLEDAQRKVRLRQNYCLDKSAFEAEAETATNVAKRLTEQYGITEQSGPAQPRTPRAYNFRLLGPSIGSIRIRTVSFRPPWQCLHGQWRTGPHQPRYGRVALQKQSHTGRGDCRQGPRSAAADECLWLCLLSKNFSPDGIGDLWKRLFRSLIEASLRLHPTIAQVLNQR
jgi:hypothetical protein